MIIHFRCLDLSVTLGHNMHFFNFFYPRDCLRANAFFCNGSNFLVSLRNINTDKQPTTDLINVLVFPKGTCKPYDDTITAMDLKS